MAFTARKTLTFTQGHVNYTMLSSTCWICKDKNAKSNRTMGILSCDGDMHW